MHRLADQYLVLRVIHKHDQTAFDELYQRYVEPIKRFIMFKVSNTEDAEDLTADVFVKVWMYLTRHDQEGKDLRHFRGLLYRMARNRVIDFYRTQGRTLTPISIDDLEDPLDIPDTHKDPLLKQMLAVDEEQVIQAVQQLKEGYREIVALRFFEELSIQEIAEIMALSPGNVRVLIHRGVKALRNILKKV